MILDSHHYSRFRQI